MADKESPPWLLGVFWFALLVLMLGTIARSGQAGYLHAGLEPAEPEHLTVAYTHVHRSAAPPDSSTRRKKLNQPYRKKAKPAAKAKSTGNKHVDAVLKDDATVDSRAGQTMRPRRLDPGKRARKFNGTIVPYFTEGALALVIGITLGFLTRLEMIVVTAVTVVFGLIVFYLEWREYTNIPFGGLWDWAWATVLNPMEGKETLAAVGGKLSAVGLATIGFFAGMKG